MLPKKYRLTRREDFATIFSKGEYASCGDGISIKYLKTGNSSVRLGFPLGKKYSKKAVQRNRAKRILRAASFPLLVNLKLGYDIIVLVGPNKKDINFAQTSKDLKKVFIKANLLMQIP